MTEIESGSIIVSEPRIPFHIIEFHSKPMIHDGVPVFSIMEIDVPNALGKIRRMIPANLHEKFHVNDKWHFHYDIRIIEFRRD